MNAYRITEFTTPVPDDIPASCDAIRTVVAKAKADKIDVVITDDGKGMVIAKYADRAAMEAAAVYSKEAFGFLIAAGVVDAEGLVSRSGNNVFSF